MAHPEYRSGKATGRFVGQVRLKGHLKPFRQFFNCLAEAQGYEAYVRAAGKEPEFITRGVMAGPTFSEVLRDCRAAGGTKGKWLHNRDKSGQGRLEWLDRRWATRPVKSITRADLERLVADLGARPGNGGKRLSPSTINRYLSSASAVFSYAVEHKLIDAVPSVPWQQEAGKRIHFLTPEQEALVVRFMEARGWGESALTVQVLCASGLRWGEFWGLELPMLQGPWIKLSVTKTNTPRDVPLVEHLMIRLKAMVLAGGKPKYGTFRVHLTRALENCVPGSKVTIHGLRHTTATRLTKRGAQAAKIQKMLGHRSYKTTEKYVHVESEDLLSLVEIVSPQCGLEAQSEAPTQVVTFPKRA